MEQWRGDEEKEMRRIMGGNAIVDKNIFTLPPPPPFLLLVLLVRPVLPFLALNCDLPWRVFCQPSPQMASSSLNKELFRPVLGMVCLTFSSALSILGMRVYAYRTNKVTMEEYKIVETTKMPCKIRSHNYSGMETNFYP